MAHPLIPLLVVLLLTGIFAAEPLVPTAPTVADPSEGLCHQLAGLLRSARKVLSDNQELINDASKGDKGLSAQVVIAKAKDIYQATMHAPLPSADGEGLQPQAIREMLAAITVVMDKAQPLINESGKGFKGFLPAVFAGQVAAEFSKNMEGRAAVKLTAPSDYIRNRRNRPDAWETAVIDKRFRSATWAPGAPFTERSEVKGRAAMRLMLPEYYTESCLKCHGDPKGERDITGGTKEGGKLGELGGAISVIIFDSK